jgi:hypothetical protein
MENVVPAVGRMGQAHRMPSPFPSTQKTFLGVWQLRNNRIELGVPGRAEDCKSEQQNQKNLLLLLPSLVQY